MPIQKITTDGKIEGKGKIRQNKKDLEDHGT